MTTDEWEDCDECGDYIPILSGVGDREAGMRLCDNCKTDCGW